MSPRDADDDRLLGEIPIRLYRYATRPPFPPRWAARIDLPGEPGIEGYGDLPDQALHDLAGKLTNGDLERLRLHAGPGKASPRRAEPAPKQ